MRLALFDIDGTLIVTRHAGMRAFYRAFTQVFGIPVEGDVIHPHGMTDPLIAKGLLAHFGMQHRWNDRARDALFDTYLTFLEEEMEHARLENSIQVLPGVTALLDRLEDRPDFALGLVTGNLERGARIKLEKASLNRYFRFGGFGSDSENRTELVRAGIERGRQLIAPTPVECALVIGDTPLDILHGQAAGAGVIAVGNSWFSMDDLRLHKPDLLVPDLTAVDEIIDFMLRYRS